MRKKSGSFLAATLAALTLVSSTHAEPRPDGAAPAPALHERAGFCTDRAARRDLAVRGGDEKTEAAVTQALVWLAAQQRADGGWSSAPLNGHDTGVTALALLAFMAHAEVPGDGRHGYVVAKGFRFLVARQRSDGRIGIDVPPKLAPGETAAAEPVSVGPPTRDVYDHAIAAQALAEAYLLTGRDEFKAPAQAAADWIAKAQNPHLGWRYGIADGDNDTSVTGWMIHALWTARAAELDVRERIAMKDAIWWLDKVTAPETGRTGYQARGGGVPDDGGRIRAPYRHAFRDGATPADVGESDTAIDLFVRMLHGDKPGDFVWTQPIPLKPRSRFEILLARRPRWAEGGAGVDFCSWYWGSLATSQAGGRVWDEWNKALKEALVPNQAPDGSWPPIDAWGRAGRVYSTAMACLCLETYYRFDLVVPAADRPR
jgi:hypothetical protein